MRKLLFLFLACLIGLAGCSEKEGPISVSEAGSGESVSSTIPLGRYVESTWNYPQEAENGSFYVLDLFAEGGGFGLLGQSSGKLAHYSSSDGKAWVTSDEALLSKMTISESTELSGFAQFEDGSYCVMLSEYGPPPDYPITVTVWKSTSGTEWEEIPIDWAVLEAESGSRLEKAMFPQGLHAGKDGSFFVQDGVLGTVCRFTADGKLTNVYPFTSRTFGVLENQIVSLDTASRELVVWDTLTEEEQSRIPLGTVALEESTAAAIISDADGALYLILPDGIFRIAPDGSLVEKMVDGTTCSLGLPSMYTTKCAAGSDGSFLVQRSSGSEKQLYYYSYDAKAPAHPETEITAATIGAQPLLRQAAVTFQNQNPDILVTINTLYDEESSMTRADAIRTLNTELLAGKGPDVLVLDQMPIQSYIDKGILADLKGDLSPLLDSGELLPNIAGSLSGENGLYAVPARFRAPILATSPENVPLFTDLAAMAKAASEHPEKRLLYSIEPAALLKTFYPACVPGWKTGSGEIDQKKLAEFLEHLKTLSENSGGQDFTHDRDGAYGPDVTEFTQEMLDTLALAFSPVRFAFNSIEADAFVMESFQDFRMPYAAVMQRSGNALSPEQAGACFLPLPGMAGSVFQPSCILGVNAASSHMDAGKKFVLTALSGDTQKNNFNDGFAVHAESLEKSIDTDIYSSGSTRLDGVGTLETECPPETSQTPLLELFRTLETPVLSDDTLYQFVEEESKAFFDGSITAEQAAGAIVERASAYLQE